MTAERAQPRPIDLYGVSQMSMPDLWVACMEHSGPVEELMAAGKWGRFFAEPHTARLQCFKTLYEQAPWGRSLDGKPFYGEAVFWTWFAIHDPSEVVRKYCAGLLTQHTGSRLANDFSVELSEVGTQVHKQLEEIAAHLRLTRGATPPSPKKRKGRSTKPN